MSTARERLNVAVENFILAVYGAVEAPLDWAMRQLAKLLEGRPRW